MPRTVSQRLLLAFLFTTAQSGLAQQALDHVDGVHLGDPIGRHHLAYLRHNPDAGTQEWKLPHGYASTRDGRVVSLTITSPRVMVLGTHVGSTPQHVEKLLGEEDMVSMEFHDPEQRVCSGYSKRNLRFHFHDGRVESIEITQDR